MNEVQPAPPKLKWWQIALAAARALLGVQQQQQPAPDDSKDEHLPLTERVLVAYAYGSERWTAKPGELFLVKNIGEQLQMPELRTWVDATDTFFDPEHDTLWLISVTRRPLPHDRKI